MAKKKAQEKEVKTVSIDTDDQEYLSKEGYADVQKKLETLKTKKRMEIAERLEYAKSLGDLSENAEYAEAKEEQMENEAEIAKLDDLLARAVVVEEGVSETIRVGSTVSCKNNGTVVKFAIVGREEANPGQGKISHESPIGHAFIGKKKNDKVLVNTPKGEVTYTILEIA